MSKKLRRKLKLSDMERISLLMWLPRVIGIVFGILWIVFGFFESILTPDKWFVGIAEGAIIGGLILLTTYILTKWELWGIVICIIESMLVLGLMVFGRLSSPVVYVILAIPLVAMATISFIHISYVNKVVEMAKR